MIAKRIFFSQKKLEFLNFYPKKGPCVGNQYAIAMHESNGLDIVTAIVVDDMESLKARIKKFFFTFDTQNTDFKYSTEKIFSKTFNFHFWNKALFLVFVLEKGNSYYKKIGISTGFPVQ